MITNEKTLLACIWEFFPFPFKA